MNNQNIIKTIVAVLIFIAVNGNSEPLIEIKNKSDSKLTQKQKERIKELKIKFSDAEFISIDAQKENYYHVVLHTKGYKKKEIKEQEAEKIGKDIINKMEIINVDKLKLKLIYFSGGKWMKFQQEYQGIPIEGSFVGITYSPNGRIIYTSSLYPEIKIKIKNKNEYEKTFDSLFSKFKSTQSGPIAIDKNCTPPKLTILSIDNIAKKVFKVGWTFYLIRGEVVTLDAETGEIISRSTTRQDLNTITGTVEGYTWNVDKSQTDPDIWKPDQKKALPGAEIRLQNSYLFEVRKLNLPYFVSPPAGVIFKIENLSDDTYILSANLKGDKIQVFQACQGGNISCDPNYSILIPEQRTDPFLLSGNRTMTWNLCFGATGTSVINPDYSSPVFVSAGSNLYHWIRMFKSYFEWDCIQPDLTISNFNGTSIIMGVYGETRFISSNPVMNLTCPPKTGHFS